jgi:hypothetical protein
MKLLLFGITFVFVFVFVLRFVLKNKTSLKAKFFVFILGRPDPSVDYFVYRKVFSDHTTDSLVVAFAGGGVMIGGISLLEFGKTVTSLNVDYILVADPFQAWYLQDEKLGWEGQKEWKEKFSKIFCHYKTILLIGNCLGGSGALLFAEMATRVIAFSPLTTLDHSRKWYWLNSRRIPALLRQQYPQLLQTSISKCPQVFIYFSKEKDTYMAAYLPQAINVHCQIVASEVGSSIPTWLKQNQKLIDFLKVHLHHAQTHQTDVIFI